MLSFSKSLLLFALIFVGVTKLAYAEVYKCKDDKGGVSYSQIPCMEAASVDKIMAAKSDEKSDSRCELLANFAAEVAYQSKKDVSIHELIDSYGGGIKLHETSLSVIKSVYEDQSRGNRTIADSVNDEANACRVKRYGTPVCNHFPVQFTRYYGGCDATGDTVLGARGTLLTHSKATATGGDSHLMSSHLVANAIKQVFYREQGRQYHQQSCEHKIEHQISQLKAKRSSARTAQQLNQLKQEQQQLMEKKRRC